MATAAATGMQARDRAGRRKPGPRPGAAAAPTASSAGGAADASALARYAAAGEVASHLRDAITSELIRAPVVFGGRGAVYSEHPLVRWLASCRRPPRDLATRLPIHRGEGVRADALDLEADALRAAVKQLFRARGDLARALATRWLRRSCQAAAARPPPELSQADWKALAHGLVRVDPVHQRRLREMVREAQGPTMPAALLRRGGEGRAQSGGALFLVEASGAPLRARPGAEAALCAIVWLQQAAMALLLLRSATGP